MLKFRKIRSGLYETLDGGNFEIERLDRKAEVFPGDDFYNKWRVCEYSSYKYEIWLSHFETLADAKAAIMRQVGTKNHKQNPLASGSGEGEA